MRVAGRPFRPGWCGRDRRGGMAGTGRGAFDYLLLGWGWGWGWGPVRSPGRGPPAANLGSRRRLRGDPHGGDLVGHAKGLDEWTACGESMGVLGWELGRSGYAGTAAPAWPGLPDRSGKLGKDVAPVGCRRRTGVPAAAMTRQGRRARGSHRPWCCAVTLAAAQQFHFRSCCSLDLNGSRRRRR